MTSLLVSNLIESIENPPEIVEREKGKIELHFKDKYKLQDFVMKIRKQGVKYGIELANLERKAR